MPPFSGKKKKEQLQAKRKGKREAEERARVELSVEDRLREEMIAKGEEVTPEALAARRAEYISAQGPGRAGGRPKKGQKKAQPQKQGDASSSSQSDDDDDKQQTEEFMYDAHGHGIRSVFTKESREEIEARRKLNFLPLRDRQPMPATGIPFGSWFRMPRRSEKEVEPLPADGEGGDAAQQHPMVLEGGASAGLPFSIDIPSRGWRGSVESVKAMGNDLACQCGYADAAVDKEPSANGTIDEIEKDRFRVYLSAMESYKLPENIAGLELISYERNLDVWRQLWRTVEVCDVNVLVADARYPIVHMHLGLLDYITRRQRKPCILVLNKSDLVPSSVVDMWVKFIPKYLDTVGLSVMSAEEAVEYMKDKEELSPAPIVLTTFSANPSQETVFGAEVEAGGKRRKGGVKRRQAKMYERLRTGQLNVAGDLDGSGSEGEEDDDDQYAATENFKGKQKATRNLQHDKREHKELQIVSKMITDLLALSKALSPSSKGQPRTTPSGPRETTAPAVVVKPTHKRKKKNKKSSRGEAGDSTDNDEDSDSSVDVLDEREEDDEQFVHIGFIGYPNVGKSSLLNCIRGTKVVSVSATPGHTKHLQTIPIPSEGVTLVDSPGLVMPCFGLPKPLQAVLGTHQIAQTRDPQSGIAYLASHLPIERLYGLRRPDGADTNEEWSAYDLCEAYATKKGYFVKHGKGALDVHRAAIGMLQEAYQGQLTIFFCPPELNFLQSKRFEENVRPSLLLPVFKNN